MMTDILEKHFPILAQAPNGITKLREMILQLAVRGKLVPQDPHDEPASVLLDKIRAEKERLIVEGKIKGQKPLEPIRKEEIPFELPEGWAWCRIKEISQDWGQTKPDFSFSYIDVSSIDNIKGIVKDDLQILDEKSAPSRARKLVNIGTVIYSTVRPYLLNIAIIDREIEPIPIVSTAFAVIHPLGNIDAKFIFYYLRSSLFTSYVESKMLGMAYPAINDSNFFIGCIPLPPLNEQKRIVERVNALMALVDRLEEEQADRDQKHGTLHKASLQALQNAEGPEQFQHSWSHITRNWDRLYTTPAHVEELKQAILQLAVQGRLTADWRASHPVVAGDPDSDARALLAQIREEKERLIAEGKIKRQQPLEPIGEDEVPFELPEGWVWCRLGEVCTLITDGSHNPPKGVPDGIPMLSATNIQYDKIVFDRFRNITQKDYQNEYKRTPIEKGDVLLTIVGTIGRTCVVNIDQLFCLQRSVALIKTSLYSQYLSYFLRSPFSMDELTTKGKGTAQKGIYLGQLSNTYTPIPPLNEQKRIVERVDELLVLCDELALGLKEQEEKAGSLVSAAVGRVG